MAETYELALNLHLFFSVLFLLLSIFYLFLTQFDGGVKFVKRIKLFMPLYIAVLASLVFMGVLVLSILKFQLSVKIAIMVISSFFIAIILVMNNKALKKAYYLNSYRKYKQISKFHLAGIFFFIIISGAF